MEELEKEEVLFQRKDDLPILLDITYQKNSQAKPVVVFCHGFKGFKDWGHFNLVADTFAQNGFVFLKFNFSKNGTSSQAPQDFVDLDAFSENTFSQEMKDTSDVLDWLEENAGESAEVDMEKIYLLGHSRGGGIAILTSAKDNRIKKLTTWAAVADFGARYTKQEIALWKEKGKADVPNSRTGQMMQLKWAHFQDYLDKKKQLFIPDAAKKVEKPWLIIHGTNDEALPFSEAKNLKSNQPKAELFPVENGTHTFGASHPWKREELPKDADTVVNKTIQFFNEQ